MVFGEKQLEHLVSLWGADHVVIGTDYPCDMGYYKPVEFVSGVKSLARAEKEAIIGGNAAKLAAAPGCVVCRGFACSNASMPAGRTSNARSISPIRMRLSLREIAATMSVSPPIGSANS